MRHLFSDLRFALRAWRNHPGFTAVAILSMALGIGANTAIFTLVDQVLLRLLPVKEPQQLVQVTMDGMHFGSNWGDGSELSFPMYTDFRDHNQVFDGCMRAIRVQFHVASRAGPRTRPRRDRHGHLLPRAWRWRGNRSRDSPDDDRLKDGHPVAVLSHVTGARGSRPIGP